MKKFITIIALTVISISGFAQKAAVERTWYNEEKTAKIQIFKATNGMYYGKIVWLKEPNDSKGNPRTDVNNPDEKLRQTPQMGLMILKSFKKTDDKLYEEGTVYDPKSGKTYCAKMTIEGNAIKLKGFICGVSFLGRTSTWTLAE